MDPIHVFFLFLFFVVLVFLGVGWMYWFRWLPKSLEKRKRLTADWNLLAKRWFANPEDRNIQQQVAGFVRRNTGFANTAYNLSLQIVERNKDSSAAKVFALETGRFACGLTREGRVPTIYDEQAIQNDIDVRSK